MRKVFLLVVLVGGLLMAVGVLALGAFPPAAHQVTVQKTLSNDRFAPRGG